MKNTIRAEDENKYKQKIMETKKCQTLVQLDLFWTKEERDYKFIGVFKRA